MTVNDVSSQGALPGPAGSTHACDVNAQIVAGEVINEP